MAFYRRLSVARVAAVVVVCVGGLALTDPVAAQESGTKDLSLVTDDDPELETKILTWLETQL